METALKILPYIGALLATFFFIACIYYAGCVLRKRYESDIRAVWYFYSLTVVVSHLIGVWAVNANAINSTGNFEGELGKSIQSLLAATLDINLSFTIILTIFTVILLPQILSYFLSAIFGVAATPRYMSESFNFLIFGVVKTFIVVSGVTTTILIFGSILSWESFSVNNVLAWFLLSITFCFFSFAVLLAYRESEEVIEDIDKYAPKKVVTFVTKIHNQCAKHSNYKNK